MKLNPIYPTAPLPEEEPKTEDTGSVVDRKYLDYAEPTQRFTGHWEQTPEGLEFVKDKTWEENGSD